TLVVQTPSSFVACPRDLPACPVLFWVPVFSGGASDFPAFRGSSFEDQNAEGGRESSGAMHRGQVQCTRVKSWLRTGLQLGCPLWAEACPTLTHAAPSTHNRTRARIGTTSVLGSLEGILTNHHPVSFMAGYVCTSGKRYWRTFGGANSKATSWYHNHSIIGHVARQGRSVEALGRWPSGGGEGVFPVAGRTALKHGTTMDRRRKTKGFEQLEFRREGGNDENAPEKGARSGGGSLRRPFQASRLSSLWGW
ncbi:hypothetical protein ACFLT5_04160, partial [Chloroflexota bacterium]